MNNFFPQKFIMGIQGGYIIYIKHGHLFPVLLFRRFVSLENKIGLLSYAYAYGRFI